MGGVIGCQSNMRGAIKSQPELVCLISPDSVVPKEHPIRIIKKYLDEVLNRMHRHFDAMYAQEGRPSIPPERLLKSKVLIALVSVRSENLFVEQLHYNLLYRWFLDMDLSEAVFDNSTFSKNQQRLMQHEVAKIFFEQVVRQAGEQGWVSDEHFSVDGTLIESWASLKSFVPKDQLRRPDDEDPQRGQSRILILSRLTRDRAASVETEFCQFRIHHYAGPTPLLRILILSRLTRDRAASVEAEFCQFRIHHYAGPTPLRPLYFMVQSGVPLGA